jgi:regulator-associated protein of mTOR
MHHRSANHASDAPGDEESHHKSAISTEYVAWASKYFLKPLQAGNKKERKDFYTAECLEQHCKLIYNYKLRRRRAAPWREPHTMDETLTIKHSTLPLHCKFHPYSDEFIFVADQDSVVKVYDSKSQQRVKFSNVTSNRTASKITSFKLVNAQYEPIVLTGTDDACVRLWKPDLITGKKTALLTAFTAFNKAEKANSSIEAGLVLEWDEATNNLLCAGDTRSIRIWDMNKELHRDIGTDIASCVCSLTSNESYAIAGFGDGTVKLFDLRLRSAGAVNQTAVKYEHNAFVLKTFLHRDSNKLITASTYGDVNITDIRNFKNTFKLPMNPEPATAIECHPVNELIAM